MPQLPKTGDRPSNTRQRSLSFRALTAAWANRTTQATTSSTSTSAGISTLQESLNEPPAASDPVSAWRDNLIDHGNDVGAIDAFDTTGSSDWDREDEDEARDLVAPIIQLGLTMGIQENHEAVHDFISEDRVNDDSLPSPEFSNDTTMPEPSRHGSSTSTISKLLPNMIFPRAESIASNWSHVLHHYAPQFEYTLEEWGEKIRNSTSLRCTKIIQVDRYRQKTGLRHRFLVFRLRRENRSRDIYLRLDRRPVAGFNPLKFLFTSGVTTANDCAILSADEGRAIHGNTPGSISILETTLTFPDQQLPPTLSHLECILAAIGANMKQYKLTSENCWFFCSIFLESLSLIFKGAVTGDRLQHAGLPTVPALRTSIYKHITEVLPALPSPSQSLPQAPLPLESRVMPSPSASSPPHLSSSPPPPSLSSSPQPLPSSLYPLPSSPMPMPAPEVKPESESESESDSELEPQFSHKIYVGAPVVAVSVHPSEDRIISDSRGPTAQLWNAATGEAVGKPLEGHTGPILSVVFSLDGQRIATGSADSTIRIWDTVSGAMIGEPLRGHASWVYSVTFTPDGRRIASGSKDETVRLWDVVTGDPIGEPFVGHTREVNSVSFSPDSRRIASASDDRTIRIWDATTGVSIGEPLRGHTNWVRSAIFSPDGQFIASGSYDETIRIWDTTGNLLKTFKGCASYVLSLAFSPNGQYIASGLADKTVQLWNASTGDTIGEPFRGHTSWVRSVAFFPDGRRLVSGSGDETIRIWDVPI